MVLFGEVCKEVMQPALQNPRELQEDINEPVSVTFLPLLEINKHQSIFLQASRIFGMRSGLLCAL